MPADPYTAILDLCRGLPPVPTAVVHPVKANVLEAVAEAVQEKLIIPVLVGPRSRIEAAATEAGIAIAGYEIIDTEHSHEAAARGAELAAQGSINTNPVYMPFITSYFMPRRPGDRPAVVPNGSKNLAFIGNFAESPTRDTVFTTEYSVRTAMEAVYTLLGVERGVPEVFGSVYDIRQLLKAAYYLRDRKSIEEEPLPAKFPFAGLVEKQLVKKLHGMWTEELLKESGLL